MLTSFAPVLLTLAFSAWLESRFRWAGAGYLLAFASLVALALGVLRAARLRLERVHIEIRSLKTVDREILGFVIAYLLPMLSQTTSPVLDWRVAVFVLIVFFAVVWGTHSYHFNPVLGVIGFHFFEVTTEGQVTYVLITRKDLRHTQGVTEVVQVGEYMVLDAGGASK